MKLAVSPLPALDCKVILTVKVRDTYGVLTGRLQFLSIKQLSQSFYGRHQWATNQTYNQP